MQSDWRPSANIETMKRRAQLLADVRLFFARRQVLEVETPILSKAAPTAPYLDSFKTDYIPIGTDQRQAYYLQTSAEFAMKRLLVSGSGSIYQVAKVFRNGESGKQHSPEFTMLEWYRVELTLEQLIDEVTELLTLVAGFSDAVRLSYATVFKQYLELDVFGCSDDALKSLAFSHIPSLAADFELDRDGWLELLMSDVIEQKLAELDQPVFIYDFPASQAQLAKIKIDEEGNLVAARFELYAGGLELANGYDELLDAEELRQRFMLDNQQRVSLGKQEMPIDGQLLEAMEAGLPQCTGVALGLDRLLMLVLKKEEINQVIFENC
ncbi:MAG: EF-P lysine aminoacylase GenX [Piscirickettsiaceae bacterium]|nr:EF-P lysine aminoacylase GenX [Piscirickettsiaceae bacterium]